MREQSPTFSIITVTFNAAKTIRRTLESVGSQSCHDYEHIIVDGASTDDTLNIIKGVSPQCRLLSEPDRGIYDAMNKGLHLAKGRYLIFLNAGDKFHNSLVLEKLAETIVRDNPDIVYGQTDIVDDNGKFLAPRHLSAPKHLSFKSFASGMLVCHQAFVVRRDLAEDYDLRYSFSADYEWCLRCLKKSRLNILIDEPLIDYLHEGVTTANRRKSLKERFDIMASYYGLIPTALRHISFFFRNLLR